MANGLTQLTKLIVGGVVVAGAITVGSLSANKYEKIATGEIRASSSSEVVESSVEEVPVEQYSPITDEMREAAKACTYEFDPASVKIEQEEKYEFTKPSESAEDPGYYDENLAGLSYTDKRDGHYLVYVFEGEYSEGYQGQYNTYLTGMYLWDDGLFAGKSNSTNFKGYWYNSSLTAPEDDPATEEDESIDTLVMVSNTENLDYIKAEPPLGGSADFYQYQAYVYMHPGWGDGRSVVVSGYLYYPNVAAFIDTNGYDKMAVGEKFIINSTWFFDRVIQNLSYTPIIPNNEITWNLPDGMIDEKKKLTAPGEYEITASWTDKSAKDENGQNIKYEATAKLEVVA